MKQGATAHGFKTARKCKNANMPGRRLELAAIPVNIIDSITITEENNINRILAEWIAYDPSITVNSSLTASQSVKLFIDWSDRNGTVNLLQGDFFTFVIPDIFIYDYIPNATDVPITNEAGEVVATYSIYVNINNMKEVRITFTDYVENHTNISGNFWLLLFVGSVASTEQKILQFTINDSFIVQGIITVNPNQGLYIPRNIKTGFSLPSRNIGGYYVFEWIVYFNTDENVVNGFNSLEGFSFEDIIPADSPHVFLSNEVRLDLGLLPNDFNARIGEYRGADSVSPESRYQYFVNQYNSTGADSWYNFIDWNTLAGGLLTSGINGGTGLNVSGIEVSDKLFSANLGNVTRPTIISFYTVSTIRIRESALGDSEVAGLFRNIFRGSYGESLSSSLTIYRFEAGGSAQGISGNYGFEFFKVNEQGFALSGALFALFTSNNFNMGADRFVFSDQTGTVLFNQLPAGIYYLLETAPPYGYLPNGTVYRVELRSDGFEIYYGANFENRLSDSGNAVLNVSEIEIQPAFVIFTGRKNLIGNAPMNGMFSFAVKDIGGNTVATGTSNEDGSIQFSAIEFNETGIFVFTVEEIMGEDSRIIYDGTVFMVTVTVMYNGNGSLTAEVEYQNGGIVFNNRFVSDPVYVNLTGIKNLTCKSMESGMFSFIVKDSEENIISTGTNDESGNIIFDSIRFDLPGIYLFTVQEETGTCGGIIYDGTVFMITVTITVNGVGDLIAEVLYPSGGIVFNNRFMTMPIKPCLCRTPCFGLLCLLFGIPCQNLFPLLLFVRCRNNNCTLRRKPHTATRFIANRNIGILPENSTQRK